MICLRPSEFSIIEKVFIKALRLKTRRKNRMRTVHLLLTLALLSASFNLNSTAQQKADTRPSIYHDRWIDLNKNGRMDVYENPQAEINARIEDLLSQMTLEEKTCQTATLYGFNRVLKDE